MDARRLLLGGVAGLIAVVGAHAAEIPVKAKAVQYVRVCTLYCLGLGRRHWPAREPALAGR
jgi:hypothetical protein